MMYVWNPANWHWPQYITVWLWALGVLLAAILHGKDRTGKHSFPVTLCFNAFGLWVYWAGGWFA